MFVMKMISKVFISYTTPNPFLHPLFPTLFHLHASQVIFLKMPMSLKVPSKTPHT